jgi:formamidopyrimidine-DNA glycosylase
MPELPDVTIYVERLQALAVGQPLERLRLADPFVLRSVVPPPDAFAGLLLASVTRLGKRVVLAYEGDLFMVVHLMIAGRLHWRPPGAPLGGRAALAALDFPTGSLVLTEQGSKRRASLHLVAGRAALAPFERAGIDILSATTAELGATLRRRNRTLKRALTDPDVVDGVGNAYSDEILHRARMSPFRQTAAMTDDEVQILYDSARAVLEEWIERLRLEAAGGFPENVTAFRPEMAVHGRYRKPCPACGAPVQRIRYADNEANYCAACQTGGRLLADRALSRLLHDDWPRTLAELEELRTPQP